VDFETVSRYYINNTLSRYLAALYRVDDSPVASIEYGGVTYTWNPGDNDNGKGSRWMPTEGEGASLLKAIVTDNEEGITSVEFTLVKENGVSIDVTFEVTAPAAPVDEGEDLVELLTRAKGYSNWPDTPEKGNFADLGTSITVEGTTVTADLSGHTGTIEGIM